MAFFYAGLDTYGLFLAHLLSVILAALLAFRLISKHYDMRAVFRAPITGPIARDMRKYGFSVMPSNLIKKLFSEFPVMMLNFVLPGGAGAAAGGYYSVARKLASALQVVRLAFEYVMAPLAAEKAGKNDKHRLADMYAFATRMSVALALPFGAALYLARADILSALEPEFQAAAAAIAILVAGRVLEAASGPSQSIIEMLGHRFLPPVNGIVGLTIFIWLGMMLIPEKGVTGAAIAAAVGLNITAYLAFFQAAILFKLFPYRADFLKPVTISLISALALIAVAEYVSIPRPPLGLTTAIIGLIVALLVLVRYGLKEDDVQALGKLGKWLGRKKSPAQ